MFTRKIQVKTTSILGTCPDIIRMSPVVRECERGVLSFALAQRDVSDA